MVAGAWPLSYQRPLTPSISWGWNTAQLYQTLAPELSRASLSRPLRRICDRLGRWERSGAASVASGELVAIRRHRGRPLSWDRWQQVGVFSGAWGGGGCWMILQRRPQLPGGSVRQGGLGLIPEGPICRWLLVLSRVL